MLWHLLQIVGAIMLLDNGIGRGNDDDATPWYILHFAA